jgi:site-specific DNA recombinase
MSSPELLAKQAARFKNSRRTRIKISVGDVTTMEKEIAALKKEEERYNKAYGAGAFTIEQLKEYATPLRARVASLESQIVQLRKEASETEVNRMPTEAEIRKFTEAARIMLNDLSFVQKRAIVVNTIDRVVGTQQQLHVYGHIPLTSYVEHFTNDRDRRVTQRRQIDAF